MGSTSSRACVYDYCKNYSQYVTFTCEDCSRKEYEQKIKSIYKKAMEETNRDVKLDLLNECIILSTLYHDEAWIKVINNSIIDLKLKPLW